MQTIPLEGWAFAAGEERAGFRPIAGPMTVAAALRALGEWSFERPRDYDYDFDEGTWWFKATLPPLAAGDVLRLDGLATLAEVFLDDRSVVTSDNMYHAHVVELPPTARELAIRFDPLHAALARKRPRPRWKTRLAAHQQLRWIRTSLVGRMPGWSPPVAPVGPWRPVVIERRVPSTGTDTDRDIARYLHNASALAAEQRLAESTPRLGAAPPPRAGLLTGTLPSLQSTGSAPALDAPDSGSIETIRELAPPSGARSAADSVEPAAVPPPPLTSSPATGRIPESSPALPNPLRVHATVDGARGIVVVSAPFAGTFAIADQRVALAVDGDRFTARVELGDVERWWPHTHGAPHRYAARLEHAGGVVELAVAFRTIALDSTNGRFTLSVNGVPMFCRGAVWTSLDVVTLTSTPADYARVLLLVKDAGMNMLRLSGTLFYEDDAFYEACDELGILVWQDFMFANMDYPFDDSAFRASVEKEARQFLERVRDRACIAVLCGGSEVEQQAAMFGADRAIWRSPLFGELLPAICKELRPDTPYWPSSPAGGGLPFHVNEGAAHYYGVGAYLRPFEDARRANVSFASECLAFANIPEDDLFSVILPAGDAPFVSARWKERSSKDFGSAWDFEDVRDHYVGRLFGVDPARVRYEDVERYIALGRVASGETMARVLAELRRAGSPTSGALIWFLQDLWPGAGWGILDSRGEPKSAYWYCRRAMAPRAVFFTDEGANGLCVHIVNERSEPLAATLEVTLYRDGETRTNGGARELVVPPRATLGVLVDSLLDRFADSSYAYRFGPPGHDVAIASLHAPDAPALLDAAWLVDFAKPPAGAGLEGTLAASHVTVKTRRFAQAVKIAVPGYSPADNYFDLAPGRTRTIPLRAIPGAKKRSILMGELSALNLRGPVSLSLLESG